MQLWDESPVKLPQRRSIRLKGYDYSQPGAYFITMVTQDKNNLFGKIVTGEVILNDIGKIVEQCWLEIPNHFHNTRLDTFIIMPNHVHGIIWIEETSTVNSDGTGTACRAPTSAIDSLGASTANSNGAGTANCDRTGTACRAPTSAIDSLGAGAADSNRTGTACRAPTGAIDSLGAGTANCDRMGTACRAPTGDEGNFHAPTTQFEQFGKPVPGSIPTIIRSFKSAVTKKVNEIQNTSCARIWQRNYHEHVIRDESSLNNIRLYITDNPLKWELIKNHPI